jgi:hypothetical protein
MRPIPLSHPSVLNRQPRSHRPRRLQRHELLKKNSGPNDGIGKSLSPSAEVALYCGLQDSKQSKTDLDVKDNQLASVVLRSVSLGIIHASVRDMQK